VSGARLTIVVAALMMSAARVRAQTQALIISGLSGEPVYHTRFVAQAFLLSSALHSRLGVPDSQIVWVGEDSAFVDPHYRGRSTKENIDTQLRRLAARATPGGQFLLVLVGHGAGEGADSRLSIPGPDLTGADFARLLSSFSAQQVAVIDLTSASGDMLAPLSAPGRVVITATKTALERNESHFGEFFVRAFAQDGADADKDGRVSLLEAYRYASAETKRLYENASKMLTEHAQLDDDGDQKGSAEPDGRVGEGRLARRFFLDAAPMAARVASDARLPALYAARFAIEEQVDSLKRRKATLAPTAFDATLEPLLVSLARTAREIRVIEGRP
jgi:hypothetical protein